MRWTIVGGNGFIGARIANYLQLGGAEVLIPARYGGLDKPPNGGFGYVVWAAGLTADFRTRPFDTVDAHVGDLSRFLDAQAFSGLLYLSSTRVYQGANDTREDASLRTSPGNPESIYNLSKLLGESLSLAVASDVARVVRLSNVVGPRERDRQTFLGEICRQAKRGKVILQSRMDSSKDYVWIGDLAPLLVQIATRGDQTIYNVAGGRNLANGDWLEKISQTVGCQIELSAQPSDHSFPPIDISRITKAFDFKPTNPLNHLTDIIA